MQKYKTYKIISLNRQQPIFICKALPSVKQPNFSKLLNQSTENQKSNFMALRQRMTKVSDKLIKSRENSPQLKYIQKRSVSFDLSKPQKLVLQARQIQQKRKKQRSIKQYLRLVYNRAERERRSNSYQLPSLKRQGLCELKLETQTSQNRINQYSQRDMKEVTIMKRKLRSLNNKVKYSQEQKVYNIRWWQIKMDKLSGWDQKEQQELI